MSNLKFSSDLRIRHRTEFIKLHLEGKRQASAILAISYLTSEQPNSRLGLVVSKKISKKAVTRNRIKRRIREAFRHCQHEIVGSYDIVVIARPKIISASYSEICVSIKKLMRAARIIEND